MRKEPPTPEMVERVIHLNTCLYKTAAWIEQRADATLSEYFAGGGKINQQWTGDLKDCLHWDDFELEAIVKCSLAADNPAFKPDDEHANLVAVIVGSQKYRRYEHEDGLTWTDCHAGEESPDGVSVWGEGLPRIEAFQQVPFCFLFHEIFQHTLHGDLEALLKIGEIEVNLMLVRQRGFALEAALLPRKRKRSYPRSVFNRTPCDPHQRALNSRELRYACHLNQKIAEAQIWIAEQARLGEKEYLALGGRDCGLTSDNAYEDYEMMLEVGGCLAENHPEYDEDDDNTVVQYSEPICKEEQRVFGRSRYIFHSSRYGCNFAPGSRAQGAPFNKIEPCGLFWSLFDTLDQDWLKMLSIGRLWFDVFIVQRRITQI